MGTELRYDRGMRGLIAATVAALVLTLAPAAKAQFNGVPASVTSIGFGGHFNSPGVPASVTSIGPLGLTPNHVFFTQPCCMQSGFNFGRDQFQHRHHDFFPVAVYPYAVPYPVAVPVEVVPEEDYSGGPTVFDRRGSGRYERDRYEDREVQERRDTAEAPAPVTQAESTPIADQPKTLLVFKDGHQLEVDNYAIIGDTLFDLSEGHHRKVPLAELNLTATAQKNDDRGVDFVLPPGSGQN